MGKKEFMERVNALHDCPLVAVSYNPRTSRPIRPGMLIWGKIQILKQRPFTVVLHSLGNSSFVLNYSELEFIVACECTPEEVMR